jgi:serine protease Do
MAIRWYKVILAVALGMGFGCRRHSAPPPPKPIPQAPAPFASAPVSPGTPDIADLVERVRPSVVNITAIHEIALPHQGWPMNRPGGGERGEHGLKEGALGSGFIIDNDGHIVTNSHVVDQAEEVRVKLADERDFHARVVAKDEALDVAVLEMRDPPHDLPAASLGSSEGLRVGDHVVAIGNPFGLGDTVTMGIISAKGRSLGAGPFDNFLQTDAPINPGNSGGPLFDLRGQVVGINAAIAPQGQGIGFAVPIDTIRRELPQLIATGHVSRGRLGISIQPIDLALSKTLGLSPVQGALIVQVENAGPAARAGLQVGDVVVGMDGRDLSHAADLPRLVASHPPGSRVRLTVNRDGRRREMEITLGGVRSAPEGATLKQP